MGQAGRPVVHAFARSPSISAPAGDAAATVLRDAFAQSWQVTAHGCLTCSPFCRDAGQACRRGRLRAGARIVRYGDASPDLMYCADALMDAFGDARLVQIVRDGRDVVAAMLADPQALAWFRPAWPTSTPSSPIRSSASRASTTSPSGRTCPWRASARCAGAARCARWPGCAALAAEQLTTLRYEKMIRQPAAAAAAVSDFLGTAVSPLELPAAPPPCRPAAATEPGAWRRTLSPAQAAEIESIAGDELRRVGYGS